MREQLWTKKQEGAYTFCFVNKTKNVGLICGFEGADIVVFGALEDFAKTVHVDTERHRPIASISLESICHKLDGNQGDMGVVHGLERHMLLIAFKVSVGDQFLNG